MIKSIRKSLYQTALATMKMNSHLLEQVLILDGFQVIDSGVLFLVVDYQNLNCRPSFSDHEEEDQSVLQPLRNAASLFSTMLQRAANSVQM